MSYRLEGKLLEVCTCEVLCPCWVGRDPDGGTRQGALAYHFEGGHAKGVDVSGVTLSLVANIPGNVLNGGWKVVILLDDTATKEQEAALLEVFTGKDGGPLADISGLIGQVVDVRRVPITFDVSEGSGTFKAGPVDAELEALVGATGKQTVLAETAFSTIPGSPAYVAKSRHYRVREPALGINVDISDHNAIQGDFRFEHAA